MSRFVRQFKVDKVVMINSYPHIEEHFNEGDILVETSADEWNCATAKGKLIPCCFPNVIFSIGDKHITIQDMLKLLRSKFNTVIYDDRKEYGKCFIIIEDDNVIPYEFRYFEEKKKMHRFDYYQPEKIRVSINKCVFKDDPLAYKGNHEEISERLKELLSDTLNVSIEFEEY